MYDGNSCAFKFFSYRDPRLSETFADFQESLNWLMTKEHKAHQLEESILGLIASMDKPGSPAGEAITACYSMLHQRTPEFRSEMRARILSVTFDDLKRVAQQYLINAKPVKGVVAPFAKRDELQALGFDLKQLN